MTTADALDRIAADPWTSELYRALLALLDGFATYEIERKKTSLHIVHGRAFLGVHPRKDALLLNIVTEVALSGSRLRKSERISSNRYHNEVLLHSPMDLDTEMSDWLRNAYALVA